MATKYAQGAINFSGTWYDAPSGGSTTTKPVSGDIADCNGQAVAIDEDITCDELRNGSASAGQFTLDMGAGARTLNVDWFNASVANRGAALLQITPHATNVLTINNKAGTGNATVTGGGVTSGHCIQIANTAVQKYTLNINVTGGSVANVVGLNDLSRNTTAGNKNINGSATGGSANSAHGITCGSYSPTDVITFTGVIKCGTNTAAGINANSCIIQLGAGSSILNYNGSTWYTALVFAKIKWPTTDTGAQVVGFMDSAGSPAVHTLKVPDYPAVGLVAAGTQYDYTPDKGTRVDCPVNSAKYTGTPYYGNPASLVDGNYYGPNLDADPGVETADAVTSNAHFGVGNATQGSAAGGGVIMIED